MKIIFRVLVSVLIFLGMLVFLFASIRSMDVCEDEVDKDTACLIVTPVLSCTSYTYDLVNLTNGNNTLTIDDGTLVQIGTTSTYNFTFNESTGQFLIILCDNSTTMINVRDTKHNKLDDIITNQTTLYTEVDAVEENQATLSSDISTLSNNMGANFSAIFANHSWINSSLSSIKLTAEGIAVNDTWKNNTLGTLKTILEGISDNQTWINNTLSDIVADTNELQTNQNWDVWDDTTRTLTNYNQTEMWSYLIELNTTSRDINSTVYSYLVPINDTVVEINVTLHGLSNLTAAQVWTHTTRMLTNYNQSLMWGYLEDINATAGVTAAQIDTQLNASHGMGLWNLTAREVDTQLNSSHPGNWSAITEIVSINETAVAEEVWEFNVTGVTGGGFAGYILRTILTIVEWIERFV